jgi:stearoyl-CoA desaturase (delta-9 desaturase)
MPNNINDPVEASDPSLLALGDAATLTATRPSGARMYDPEGRYDGVMPFPSTPKRVTTTAWRLQVATTIVLVGGPVVAVGAGVWLAWGHGISWLDLILGAVLYTITGLGVTVGYHRMLTHRSFTALPWLRVTLAAAGAMAFEGDPIGWVAGHRRHHAFTDRPGDPHSPYRFGTGPIAQIRGLLDAHMGWLLRNDPTPPERWAPDLLADRGIARVARLFPALSALSLALPFVLGWVISGSFVDGLLALLWAGVIRVALFQHVSWSVNSLCHVLGNRPFKTRPHDRATNLWPLAVPSFGEAWHNAHHADPTCARHGVERGQLDLSAELIRLMERAGWVSDVHWPTAARLAALRR